MRISRNYIILFILFIFYPFFFVFSQNYELNIINKSPLYATASILQDYDNDGDLDIIITRRRATTDPDPSSVELLENDGTGQFPRTTLFESVSLPVDIDQGDFNNDGNIDFVVSDRYQSINSGAVVLALKQNDGSFSLSLVEDSIRTDQSAVADFNNDGNLDIVSTGFNRLKVSIYFNDGNAAFTKQEITDSVTQVDLVEANDIDDDGDFDIVYGGGGLEGFKILYNNGSGVFDSSKTLYLTNQQYSNANGGMNITDLNNDGIKDILAFSGVGFGGMYFLDGSSDFASSIIDIDGIDLGGDIVAADIDNNGFVDIIRQNFGDDYLSIIYQAANMEFTFEILEMKWDNRGPGQMSLGDLDNDGDTDLVFPENGNTDGDISWFENINGRLYRHHLYGEIEAVRIPILVDIDEDGDLDVIVSAGDDGPKSEEDELIWFENQGENNFIEHRIDDDISYPGGVKTGDLDGDGSLEIVATGNEDSSLVWYKYDGIEWVKVLLDENLINPLGCEITDLDSDNDNDIVVCSTGENEIIFYENNGSAIFTRKVIDNSILAPVNIISDDYNGDGEMDLAVASSDTNNTLVLLINDGNENFSASVIAQGQNATSLVSGDWNNDNVPDIFAGFDKGVLGDARRDIAVFLNDGNASFTDSSLVVLEERTSSFTLFDADNDNDMDIAIGSAAGIFPVRLAINDNGSISDVVEIIDRGTRVYGIAAGDLDGDGINDLVASDQYNATNNLLLFTSDLSTDIFDIENQELPVNFALNQNYPNPFNPVTKIKYSIPLESNSEKSTVKNIKLQIFDILGREVATLVNKFQKPGNYEIEFDGSSLPSGIYFYRLLVNGSSGFDGINFSETKRMLLLK